MKKSHGISVGFLYDKPLSLLFFDWLEMGDHRAGASDEVKHDAVFHKLKHGHVGQLHFPERRYDEIGKLVGDDANERDERKNEARGLAFAIEACAVFLNKIENERGKRNVSENIVHIAECEIGAEIGCAEINGHE